MLTETVAWLNKNFDLDYDHAIAIYGAFKGKRSNDCQSSSLNYARYSCSG